MFGIVLDFGLTGLFLLLDGMVYWLISKLFGLYEILAGTEIIKNEFFQQITSRIYVVIGIFMLFVVAYSLLKSLVNPDNLSKDTGKIVTNIVISLVLLSVVPLVFQYARNLQNIIVGENVIGKIILEDPDQDVAGSGRNIALSILEAFLYIPDSEEGYSSNEKTIKLFGKEIDVGGNHTFELQDVDGGIVTWGQLKEYIRDGADANFMKIGYWAESVHEEANGTTYIPFISTIAGAFLIYVLLSFCIDLGVRVVKLAFYQLIAPIPIMMRILPEKKSVFDNWVKGSIATYMEVFIRLFIMFLVMWIVSAIFDGDALSLSDGNIFVTVIVVMGIFAFAKQAPKLISDVIGVDSGNIKLGIGGKLAAGGALGIGAMLGGGVTSFAQNLTRGWGNVKNSWKAARDADGNWNKFKAVGSALSATTLGWAGSVLAGTASGAARSASGGFKAKNYGEARAAARQGIEGASKARGKREAYKSRHGGTVFGVAKGHLQDFGTGFKNWATGGAAGILSKVAYEEEFKNSYDDFQAIYENASYKAMDAQLEQYKAMEKAGNTKTQDGTDLDVAIKTLEGNMLQARMKAIASNTQASAYAMYNIVQNAKRDSALANQIGIDVSKGENLQLRGNTIIDKKTGKEIEATTLFEMIEGSAVKGVTYNKTTETFSDASGGIVNFKDAAEKAEKAKDGMRHQKKKATIAINADKVSIDYKEALKRQEANKK